MNALNDMLAAREARAEHKMRAARLFGRAVVCITLRACAEARAKPEFIDFFRAECVRAGKYFERAGIKFTRFGGCVQSGVRTDIARRALRSEAPAFDPMADGPYQIYITDDARRAKALAIEYEDTQPRGALIDIDVMNAQGEQLTRVQMGRAPRACIVCGGMDARECIVSRAHTREQLLRATQEALAAGGTKSRMRRGW